MRSAAPQVDVTALLAESEDGDQSAFLECVRDQFLQEVLHFQVQFKDALVAAARAAAPEAPLPELRLRCDEVARVLREVDADRSQEEIREALERGTGDAYFTPDQQVRITELLARLYEGLFIRARHWSRGDA
jgi:hypothetical protein